MFGSPLALLLMAGVVGSLLSNRAFQRIVASSTARIAPPAMVTNQVTIYSNQVSTISTTSVTQVSVSPGIAAATAFTSNQLSRTQQIIQQGLTAAVALLGTLFNLMALGWFGMWMGLTTRTANLATLKTILFVQVIPTLIITFGSGVVVGLTFAASFVRKANAQPAFLCFGGR